MAQEMAQGNRDDNGRSPSVEDVRTAVLHLVELAAAYEGKGLEVDEPSEVVEADTRALFAVTKALLRHRAVQRRRQLSAVLRLLSQGLGEMYRTFAQDEEMSAGHLQDAIVNTLSVLGMTPTDAELDELVVDRRDQIETHLGRRPPTEGDVPNPDEERADVDIKSALGPLETAKRTLSRTIGRSQGTIGMARRSKQEFMARVAFGRYLTRAKRTAYGHELLDAPPFEARDGVRLADHGAEGPSRERAGLILDAGVESALGLVTRNDRLLRQFIPTLTALDTLATDWIALLCKVCRLAASTDVHDPKVVDDRIPDFFGVDVRSAAQALLEARRDHPQRIGEAEAALEKAVRSDMRRLARTQLAALFGDLDVLPMQVNAVTTTSTE